MGINLQKGQRIDLDKNMLFARAGLGWDTNKYDGGLSFDLDVSVFLLGAGGKLLQDEDFIFYNNMDGRNGAVVHQGDNRTGDGDGDDEVIVMNFSRLPAEIERLAICVTIHEAEEKRQNFGQVSNAYIRLLRLEQPDDQTGEEILRFDLEEDFSIETGLVVAEIYRKNGAWKFNAVGAGYQGGLAALCRSYGADV